jgi:hypothetical protein
VVEVSVHEVVCVGHGGGSIECSSGGWT